MCEICQGFTSRCPICGSNEEEEAPELEQCGMCWDYLEPEELISVKGRRICTRCAAEEAEEQEREGLSRETHRANWSDLFRSMAASY